MEFQELSCIIPVILCGGSGSARYFPTIFRIAKRVLFKVRSTDYLIAENPFPVDWVAGMFVVYRRDAFKQVKGFDDKRFFMYLEDADICRRLAKAGWLVFLNPDSQVFHFAQRKSRTNFMHMRWHIISLLRYISGL
jgi:N-acetylglucosaminyl-diphospho-decaprenol L-rhamnosyltransferase